MEDFGPHELLECYARGVFPMADSRTDEKIFLVDPHHRGVLPLDGLHIPRRLARKIRSEPFEIRIDTAFTEVVSLCAQAAPDRPDTWINGTIEHLYEDLFAIGHAHSVECWKDGSLVGGLYGVSLGGAFFGESMFSRETDASKVALTYLVAQLIVGGFQLLDTQFITDHLKLFGTEEIPRKTYHQRLRQALKIPAYFGRVAPMTGAEVLQVTIQTS